MQSIIPVNSQIDLTPFCPGDKALLLQYPNDPVIRVFAAGKTCVISVSYPTLVEIEKSGAYHHLPSDSPFPGFKV